MNVSIGAQLVKKASGLLLGLLFLAALAGLIELLYRLVPDMRTLAMYLLPQFFGLGIMTYVIFTSREAVETAERRVRSLVASEERFAYLYQSSPVPYLNIKSNGEIFLLNLAAIRLFATTEPKMLGLSLFDFLYHESETKLSIIQNQLQSRMALSDVELQVKTMDGRVRWVLLSAFVYGKRKEQLVSLVDITRQKEIEMAKTEFVTLASHQLRTPIAATRWNFELLVGTHEEPTKEQKLYLERVTRNIDRLTALVNDFLHVSKLELGTYAGDTQRISIPELVKSVLEEFEKLINEKQLSVNTEFQPEDLHMSTDPRLMRIILSNLVSNAAKYTNVNGAIKLKYEIVDNDIVFEVADTGIGVPVAEISKLFRRFYRASNAQEQHVEGTGLGLYIAKQAVEKLEGSITVNSNLGKGSAFIFRLPFED